MLPTCARSFARSFLQEDRWAAAVPGVTGIDIESDIDHVVASLHPS
jgi:hypothetical protein